MVIKKAQLKIQQMAFMLIAVTLFFVFVGLFVLAIRFAGLKEASEELEQKNAMLLVAKLANSPEFSCEEAFGFKTNCIDEDKIMALAGNAKYQDFWGVGKIELRKIYPVKGNNECTKENYPDCGIIVILTKQVNLLPATSTYVSLCRKESGEAGKYDSCELAKIILAAEDKTK